MISILYLTSDVYEVCAIKKRIIDEIFACEELPHGHKWVSRDKSFYSMFTDNCMIKFRPADPEKTCGLSDDIVIGSFNNPYSADYINQITGKSGLGLQKKYGESGMPIWEIVLDIEKRFAKAMEEMFV